MALILVTLVVMATDGIDTSDVDGDNDVYCLSFRVCGRSSAKVKTPSWW